MSSRSAQRSIAISEALGIQDQSTTKQVEAIAAARAELAALREEVERLRGAASVDVEARRLVDALTANGEHEFLIDEERVESLPDEQHNEIVYALRALRTALGAQDSKEAK